jgi:hypothetical protein
MYLFKPSQSKRWVQIPFGPPNLLAGIQKVTFIELSAGGSAQQEAMKKKRRWF